MLIVRYIAVTWFRYLIHTLFAFVSSVGAPFALSSAKRNTSSTSVCTLDLACNLVRLKSFPPKWYLIGIPLSPSWKTFVSMTENIMLYSVEASTQLALLNFIWHRKWIRKLAIILDPCKHTIVELPHHCYEFGRTAKVCHIFQSPSWMTVSDAYVRSTKVMYWSTFCSWHFSWSCLAVKIMSIVLLSFLNPHWLSGRSPDYSSCSCSRSVLVLQGSSQQLTIKGCLDDCRRLEDSISFWIGGYLLHSWILKEWLIFST